MSCGGDDDCDEERNFRAGEDLQRGIRSGHYGRPNVCPLEANWVSAGFAAPGEGQEEPPNAWWTMARGTAKLEIRERAI
jgi:hypothetical protein